MSDHATPLERFTDAGRGGGFVMPFRGQTPELGAEVFLAPTSTVIGRAKLGRKVSVWFNSVVRADIAPIEIGEETNIQDNSVLHVGDEFPCLVGARVVVGHRAILHGCTVGDGCLIGMGATLLNGSKVGEGSIIAAGAVVTEGMEIPPGSIAVGTPARVVRQVSEEQRAHTLHLAEKYTRVAGEYLAELGNAGR